jgi:hypothetical protein
MFSYLPPGRALDDGSTAPVPAAPPLQPAITDLDWHFTIAYACIATALDMCNVPVDGDTTQKQPEAAT